MKLSTAAAAARRLNKLERRRLANEYREPRPERVPVPITLPAVRMVSITDADIGLDPHDGAQLRAEDYVRIAAAARLRAEQAAERDDAAILDELRRLERMPLPKWMRPDVESA